MSSTDAVATIPAGWRIKQGFDPFGNMVLRTYGASATNGLYNWGANPALDPVNASDRALSAIADNYFASEVTMEFRLTNNEATSFTGFSLGFTGVQWRQNTGARTVEFRYSLNGLLFRPIHSLYFTTPQTGVAGQIDGYSPANRVVFNLNDFTFYDDETWDMGETLTLQWFNPIGNTSNKGIGMGIDDVFFNAIPEPRMSLFLGILAIFFFLRHFRRKVEA
ncbi:MAG: hypothetical protein ACK5NG_09165 [Chthoniobacterales bacterium]